MRLSAKKTALFLFYLCLLIFAGLQIYGAFANYGNDSKKMFWNLDWNKPHMHVQIGENANSIAPETASRRPQHGYVTKRAGTIPQKATKTRTDVPFIPNWKDMESFRRDVEFLNHQGFIYNELKFKPRLTAESIVFLVQVHSRADQLQMQIDSFSKMRYINETLIIFSHDFYSQDVFDVIAKIDFCPYVQIFYPYAIQVYNNQFPGDDPKDCPRNLIKDEARKRKCNNAEYQDPYGHYREATHAQLKHHWLWKLQFIFENCSLLRNFEGIIFRLDDDYYLAEDTIDYLRKLDRQSRIQCPECKMYIMGQSTDYSHDEYKSGAAKKDYWWAGNGRGMAFRKDFWKLFKDCAKSFCLFDDCNWDWSLMHVTATCIPGGLKILKPLGSRVFHLGSCKGFHQNRSCKTTDVLNNVLGILRRNRNYLFPENVNIPIDFPSRSTLDVPYGGWTDIRDHQMCLRIFNNESLSTTDFRKIHQKLFR
ncbi:alpha-1,6-mannosyl-glycoprotein 2-beta-N-acetylglucosaminyltransferase-like [Gigantopelta aegis]|uniref:alpha-1,6-mannosyl-glycoprotein 2-beta-N-acetylglucosaminyltransferase-like n=1 Tax=Gigantopelta aegis TaxID=1735272 RepID=UPI001B889C35|nr:alpha-1,6-mannosyl-glycoprotein 2-beta-N-acetylglucosaminyltransferase-like [Gigantopelta aegis]